MSFRELLLKEKLMDRLTIKIKFDQPLTYADAERNFVKCTLRGVMRLPKDVAVPLGLPSKINVQSRTITECKNGDVFSAEKGRKIAIARCEMKIYKKTAEKLVKMWKRGNDINVDYLSNPDHPTLNSIINEFVRKANGCVAHNARYIQEIGG